MDIGSRIAAWRSSKGLTQRELAEAIGLTRAAVYHWENGKAIPSSVHVEAVAAALGIPMDRFYGRVPAIKKVS